MEELLQYLLEKYGYDEPIFSRDLCKNLNVKGTTLRQNLKRLIDSNRLERYENGIYFIPKPNSLFKKKSLSFNKVINKKYLLDQDKIIGYRTGIAFANDLRLTTQTAGVLEIATNKETNRKRKVQINNHSLILRKPRIKITEENYKILQVLDLITDVEKMSEKSLDKTYYQVKDYVKNINLDKIKLNRILDHYPAKTKIQLYESGLLNELTRG